MLPAVGLLILLLGPFQGCSSWSSTTSDIMPEGIPRAEREFRAVWVATVVNIDWPSTPGLPPDSQRAEAIAILDTAAAIGLNAIVLQVRPHCDAMYASEVEPWSYYLTGTQGKAPEPYYDPLSFWIAEAHHRGIELHAWFNPYRAHITRGGEITSTSIVRRRPDLAKQLPDGSYWLDPAQRETREYTLSVIRDVLIRYDVDGIHFDDYFYPYGDGDFPDDDSWAEYRGSGGTMSRAEWRRNAVNTFVEEAYEAIRDVKPTVKFGLSPFGIWRPGYPPSISGLDQYNGLYADARLWLNRGWLDYWSPQLYWPISQVPQSFPVLLGWWERQNVRQRNLWPGLFTQRMLQNKGIGEVVNQIMVIRGMLPESPGHIHFSMAAFMHDSTGLADSLRQGAYRRGALVPPSPWLDDDPPDPPEVYVARSDDSVRITWGHPLPQDIFRWVLYYQYGGRWEYRLYNRDTRSAMLPLTRSVASQPPAQQTDSLMAARRDSIIGLALSAVDRLGNESTPRMVTPSQIPRSGISSSSYHSKNFQTN